MRSGIPAMRNSWLAVRSINLIPAFQQRLQRMGYELFLFIRGVGAEKRLGKERRILVGGIGNVLEQHRY